MTPQKNKLPYLPQLLLIGAMARNSGKTTIACHFIRQWRRLTPVYALKLITVDRSKLGCHRGIVGCGICSSLAGSFEIIEEDGGNPAKDTSLMLAAGATGSYLIKSDKDHVAEAFQAFLALVPKSAVIVAESNTLRRYVEPGAFIMSERRDASLLSLKPSALAVQSLADIQVDVVADKWQDAVDLDCDALGHPLVKLTKATKPSYKPSTFRLMKETI